MSDFDDARLLAAMRAFLDAADEVARAVQSGDDRAVIDCAEQRAIAAMALRHRLVALGWSVPKRPATRSGR